MVVVERLGKFDRMIPAGLGVIVCPCEQKAGSVSFRKWCICFYGYKVLIAIVSELDLTYLIPIAINKLCLNCVWFILCNSINPFPH